MAANWPSISDSSQASFDLLPLYALKCYEVSFQVVHNAPRLLSIGLLSYPQFDIDHFRTYLSSVVRFQKNFLISAQKCLCIARQVQLGPNSEPLLPLPFTLALLSVILIESEHYEFNLQFLSSQIEFQIDETPNIHIKHKEFIQDIF